jgi:hypothetical protein
MGRTNAHTGTMIAHGIAQILISVGPKKQSLPSSDAPAAVYAVSRSFCSPCPSVPPAVRNSWGMLGMGGHIV